MFSMSRRCTGSSSTIRTRSPMTQPSSHHGLCRNGALSPIRLKAVLSPACRAHGDPPVCDRPANDSEGSRRWLHELIGRRSRPICGRADPAGDPRLGLAPRRGGSSEPIPPNRRMNPCPQPNAPPLRRPPNPNRAPAPVSRACRNGMRISMRGLTIRGSPAISTAPMPRAWPSRRPSRASSRRSPRARRGGRRWRKRSSAMRRSMISSAGSSPMRA